MKIGWIGLGNMGLPMVKNLVHAGYEVIVYNRTSTKVQQLQAEQVTIAASPYHLAEQADVIITMVSDGTAVREILVGPDGIRQYLKKGQIVIDMSTIGPDQSRTIAFELEKQGVSMIDAPVSGSVKPAEDGTLVILVGGEPNTYKTCAPIFDILGKAHFYMGPNGKGLEAKLAVNLMLGVTMQGISEALVLAEKGGLDRQLFLQMIGQTAVFSPIIQAKIPSFVSEAFPPAFALKHMNKDMALAVELARKQQVALPMAAASHMTYTSAEGTGKGDMDVAAILLQLLEQSGITEKEHAYETAGGIS